MNSNLSYKYILIIFFQLGLIPILLKAQNEPAVKNIITDSMVKENNLSNKKQRDLIDIGLLLLKKDISKRKTVIFIDAK